MAHTLEHDQDTASLLAGAHRTDAQVPVGDHPAPWPSWAIAISAVAWVAWVVLLAVMAFTRTS